MHSDGCDCHGCWLVRRKVSSPITSPQPTMAEAMQQALAVVGRKYFDRGIATQEAVKDDGASSISCIVRRSGVDGSGEAWARDKVWARDVWIAEHEAQLAEADRFHAKGYSILRALIEQGSIEETSFARDSEPSHDQINDLLSEISENDRRIQAIGQTDETPFIMHQTRVTKEQLAEFQKPGGYVVADSAQVWEIWDAKANHSVRVYDEFIKDGIGCSCPACRIKQNAYHDRIKLEAHQARLDRNNSFESRLDPPAACAAEKAASDSRVALGRAMAAPTQTELPLNAQVLSARYGRPTE